MAEHGLSEDEVADLQEAFSMYDADGGGTLHEVDAACICTGVVLGMRHEPTDTVSIVPDPLDRRPVSKVWWWCAPILVSGGEHISLQMCRCIAICDVILTSGARPSSVEYLNYIGTWDESRVPVFADLPRYTLLGSAPLFALSSFISFVAYCV